MVDPIVEDAYDYMRAHLVGRIRFGEDRLEMRVAPAPDGSLVGSVMVAMLRSMDTALELPDDGEDSLELQVTLEEINESGPFGAFCDRWQIYHGEPPDVRWARMVIDAGRYKGHFIDGLGLTRANPFAAEEVALCREINAKHAALLAPAAFATGGHKLAEPKLVAVDPWGFDIRGQLGIARLACHPPIASAADALPRLTQLASQAGRST